MGLFSKPEKLGIIRLMMITAQLLLLGLVVHWISMQYKEHKQLLEKDLETAWNTTQQQMVDSMLLKNYIDPALDSNAKFNFRFEFNTDSLKKELHHEESAIISSCIPPITMPAGNSHIVVRVSDTIKHIGVPMEKKISYMSRDLVLQGVKLFVNTQSDSIISTEGVSSAWSMEEDTLFIKSSFERKMRDLSPLLGLNWTTKIIADTIDHFQPVMYSIMTGNKTIIARIDGKEKFIVARILPQLGFAVILLLLTGTAFTLSFRSLKNQTLLNSQRDDFIRNMSHELKTPVATVKVALEALKKFNLRNDPAVMDEYLDMATSETERLELLISRVMHLSTQNGDSIRPDLEKADLAKLVKDVIHAMKPRLASEEAILTLSFPDQVIQLEIDRLHVSGVLINLLDNSLKYSERPASIGILVSIHETEIQIVVSDKGKGIPAVYQSRIFEKFFRVPTGDTHNVKGYGLGLTYARMVMEQHGGTISYEPNPGGGSLFTLSFPTPAS